MRNLSVVPNIGGTSSAYPDGVIVDNASGITGTGVTELLYGDPIQTAHKLKRLSGITPNGLPDNETNGFQLLRVLLEHSVPPWYAPSSNVVYTNIKFVTYNNGLYFHKTTNNTPNNPAVDTTNWALVFRWNGSIIIYSDEQRTLDIEAGVTALGDAIDPLVTYVAPVDLALGSGFSGYISNPQVTKRGYSVMISGAFFRTSGSGVLVATIPVGSRPLRSASCVAAHTGLDGSTKVVNLQLNPSTGGINLPYDDSIINGDVYSFTATYLL